MSLIEEQSLQPKQLLREEIQLGFRDVSCTLDSPAENVVVKAIVILELELCNVKMQVFLTDIVECTDDTALEDAPATAATIAKTGRGAKRRSNPVLRSAAILDCFAEPVVGRAFARPVGSQ